MKKEQREINQRQKEFYQSFKKNFATRLWYSLRNGILTDFRKSVGVEKQWLNNILNGLEIISDKKVLDLGCYEGNSLSIASWQKMQREYIAIDLSEKAIKHLRKG